MGVSRCLGGTASPRHGATHHSESTAVARPSHAGRHAGRHATHAPHVAWHAHTHAHRGRTWLLLWLLSRRFRTGLLRLLWLLWLLELLTRLGLLGLLGLLRLLELASAAAEPRVASHKVLELGEGPQLVKARWKLARRAPLWRHPAPRRRT